MADGDPVGSGCATCGGTATSSSSAFDDSSDVVSPEKKSWIAIKLVDEDGKPVPNEEYRVILPDGSTVEGDLNKRGFACLRGIDPGTCQITFPNLDQSAWKPK